MFSIGRTPKNSSGAFDSDLIAAFCLLAELAGRRRPIASDTIGRLCGNVGRIRILTDGLDLAR
jgi:hypothetical protein